LLLIAVKPLNRFYTYAYLRDDGSPYYIGKGSGKRAWARHPGCAATRPIDKSKIVILKNGLTEEQAFCHERYMIFVFGRRDLGTGILRNQTNGGVEGLGLSEITKKRMSNTKKNKENITWRGRKHSAETKQLLTEQRKQYEYTFYGPNGEVITGVSTTELCTMYPELQRSNLIAVARGTKSIHKGWFVERCPVQASTGVLH
jgi:hypothetical protein